MDKYLEKIKELKVEIKNKEEELCYIEDEISMNENKYKELNKAIGNESVKMKDTFSTKKDLEHKIKNQKKIKRDFIINFFFNYASPFTYGIIFTSIILQIIFPVPLEIFIKIFAVFSALSVPGWLLSLVLSEENNGYFKTKKYIKSMNIEDIENDIEKQKEKVNSIDYLKNIIEKKLEELNLNKETIKREINNKLCEIINIEKAREKAINKCLVDNPEVNDLFNQEYIKLENDETIKNEKQFVKCKKSTNGIN